MKPSLLLALAAAGIVLFSAGCRRKSNSPLDPPATGRPTWSPTEITVIEGRTGTATLSLNRIPSGSSVNVSVDSDEAGEVTFPSNVTFVVGDTTESVTIGGVPLETGEARVTVLTASTNNGSSELVVTVLDDDGTTGGVSSPVTWGPGRVLLLGVGADLLPGTADDELIVASGVGSGTPVLTRGGTGPARFDDPGLPVVTGVGDSVLLLTAAGALPLLTQMGAIETTPAVTATLNLTGIAGAVARPVMVGARAVLVTLGIDGVPSFDDAALVIDGIGGTTLTSRSVSLPGLALGDPCIPVAVGPHAFVIVTAGADLQFGTGDEGLVLVHSLDTTPVTVPLAAGRIHGSAAGRPMVSGGTIAAVMTAGFDGAFGTADDALQVVRDLLTGPAPAVPLVVGPATPGAEGLPFATGADAAVIPLLGADLTAGTGDDEIAVVTALSLDPMSVLTATAPNPAPGPAGAMVQLSSSDAVRLSRGPDGALGTPDDALVLLGSLGPAPTSLTLPVGALRDHPPLPTSSSGVALAGEGPDNVPGTEDDRTWSVTGIGTSPLARSLTTGAFAPLGRVAAVPTPSGHSIAGVTAGEDAAPSTADDRLSVNAVP
ncbi:MAG: hypothetical protein HUU15_14765 [Candidatus Brocadiae bacterium]|nr:hypothetical protein [Candidatus Brocadiia bacterium]